MTYLRKLSLMARWFLPSQDGDEVVEDYVLLLAHDDDPYTNLGAPLVAVRELCRPGQYYRWLAAFIGMVFCLVVPALAIISEVSVIPSVALLVVAAGLAFIVFRRNGQGRRRLPRGILLSAGLVALIAAGIVAVILYFLLSAAPVDGRLLDYLLKFLALLSLIAGIVGLIAARMLDYRWRALYLLSLATVAVGAVLDHILHTLSVTVLLYDPLLVCGLIIAAVGLILAGRGMC